MSITFHPTVTKILTYKCMRTVSQHALCTQSHFSYFSVKTSFLRPILNCSMCFCLQFSMQQLICITWWVCRCTAIFAEAAVSAASDATWDKSAVFGLPVGFNKSWNHEEGVHIQNLLQGYEVRADWWTSVGSATLAVRFGPAMPPTPLVKRCDLYCGTSLSRLVLQCHLQHAVFLVNILCRDVLLFWQKVNEKWWNYYT